MVANRLLDSREDGIKLKKKVRWKGRCWKHALAS